MKGEVGGGGFAVRMYLSATGQNCLMSSSIRGAHVSAYAHMSCLLMSSGVDSQL